MGRSEELAFIDRALRRVDRPRGVLLAGSAGVGKTRLAREAAAIAERRGTAVHWVSATMSSQPVPLGAFSGLVDDIDDAPTRLLSRVTERLASTAGSASVVLVTDDGHLLDEVSALLVHQLSVGRRVGMLVTIRTGDPCPSAIAALWKDELLERLELQPLSQMETTRLVEVALGGQVDSTSATRIWELTRGNMLFLRNLVEGEVAAGRVHDVRGVWVWDGRPTLSPGLLELVELRMGSLSDAVREVVDVLAIGEPVALVDLVTLTDGGAVEQAELLGLVRVDESGDGPMAWLAHPMYGEVRRARLGGHRARRLRGRLVSELSHQDNPSATNSVRQAVIALDSDLAPDADKFASAARTCMLLADLPLCERMAAAAVGAGGGFDMRLLHAYAMGLRGRCEQADAKLVQLSEVADDDMERSAVAMVRSSTLFWGLHRPIDAEVVINEAELSVSDVACRRHLGCMRAAFDGFLGRSESAVELATDLLSTGPLTDQAAVMATFGLVVGLGELGRSREIDVPAKHAYDLCRRSFDATVPAFGLVDVHVTELVLAGRLHDAQRITQDFLDWTDHLPGAPPPFAPRIRGMAALTAGRLKEAIHWLREARAGLLGVDPTGFAYTGMIDLTRALALIGDAAAAREALAEMEAHRHPSFAFLDPAALVVRAQVAAAEGAMSEAIAQAHDAAVLAAERRQPAHEVQALQVAVNFGDSTVADRLDELSRIVDGPRAAAATAHAYALAADDPAALHHASVQLEAYGDIVAAAEAAAHAAAACERRGQPGGARRAAVTAARLAAAAEGARTPAIIASAQPLPLTKREREIVALAAQGFSSRQIAERLVVSVRTVEGHLYRAYGKLGVTDRAQLAPVLGSG